MVDVHPLKDDARGNAQNPSLSTVDEKAEDTDSTRSPVSHGCAALPSALQLQLGTEGGNPYDKLLALLTHITEKKQQVREETPLIVRSTSPGSAEKTSPRSEPKRPAHEDDEDGRRKEDTMEEPAHFLPDISGYDDDHVVVVDRDNKQHNDEEAIVGGSWTMVEKWTNQAVEEDIVVVSSSSSSDHRGGDPNLNPTHAGSKCERAYLRSMPNRFPHLPHEVHEVLDTQQVSPQFLAAYSGQCFVLIEHELIPDHWYSLQMDVEPERVCVGWRWSYRRSSYAWPSWVHSALCREDEANPHRKLNDLVNTLKEWVDGTLSTARMCDARYPRIFEGKHQLIFDVFHTATIYRDIATDGTLGGLRCEWV